jgi:hypothetical protein
LRAMDALSRTRRRMPRSSDWFVKAPIPWIWFAMLALGCERASVALRACFEMRHGDRSAQLSAGAMRECLVTTRTRWRALKALEAAGLAHVDWQGRAGPVVTCLEPPSAAPPAFMAGLAGLAPLARQGKVLPREVLAALPRPSDHVGPWPTTATKLLRLLRQVNPNHVVRRGGRLWVVLDPTPATGRQVSRSGSTKCPGQAP